MKSIWLVTLIFTVGVARGDAATGGVVGAIQDPYQFVCGDKVEKTAEQLKERSQEIDTVYQAAAIAFAKNHSGGSANSARELMERIEQGIKRAKEKGLVTSPEGLRSRWPEDPLLDQALEGYLDYLVMTEDAAIRWVNLKRNLQGSAALDPNRVAELVSLAKSSLKIAVNEEPGWSPEERKAALRELDPVQALTPSRIRSIGETVDRHYLTLVYFLRCGPSGAYVSLFSKTPEAGLVNGRVSHGRPIMAVCPGIILSFADQPDITQTLQNLFAHEMAHQFDVSVKDKEGFLAYDGTVLHRDFSKGYRNFHRCMSSGGYKDLGDARKVISEYKAKAADPFFSEDERARYALQAELLETRMNRVVTRVGREPTKLETHQEEIDADYWSFSELGQSVGDMPTEPARQRVKQSLSYLCSTGDDGFRPSGKFRIGMAFQNRVIAAKAGYKPIPNSPAGSRPDAVSTCQISGEVEMLLSSAPDVKPKGQIILPSQSGQSSQPGQPKKPYKSGRPGGPAKGKGKANGAAN